MADIHRLRSDDELGDEACEWLARLNAHDVSAHDKAQFEAWRAADPRHARAVEEAALVWRRLVDAGDLARAVSEGQQFNSLTDRAIERSLQARARARRVALAAAATVVVALSAGWWYGIQRPDDTFRTAIGEHSIVKLQDGSSLELNSDSRVRVTYTDRLRVVTLEQGEAYFDVKGDSKRPFWVAAGESWVGAVGTAFSVDMRSAGVRVTVREGAVKVAARTIGSVRSIAQPVTATGDLVQAGQQFNMRGDAREVRSLSTPQLARSLAWRAGQIYFKEDRLADVVDELKRYSGLDIVIEDDGSRQFTLAGTFETNAEGIEALLASLEKGFGLNVRRTGSTVHISKR